MSSTNPTAGGFFLIIAILVGFGIGASQGQQLLGAVAGTLVGTIIAVAMWLRDRNRSR